MVNFVLNTQTALRTWTNSEKKSCQRGSAPLNRPVHGGLSPPRMRWSIRLLVMRCNLTGNRNSKPPDGFDLSNFKIPPTPHYQSMGAIKKTKQVHMYRGLPKSWNTQNGGTVCKYKCTHTVPPLHDTLKVGTNVFHYSRKNYSEQHNSYTKPQNAYSKPRNAYRKPQNAYRKPQNAYRKPRNDYTKPRTTKQTVECLYKATERLYKAAERLYKASGTTIQSYRMPSILSHGTPLGDPLHKETLLLDKTNIREVFLGQQRFMNLFTIESKYFWDCLINCYQALSSSILIPLELYIGTSY